MPTRKFNRILLNGKFYPAALLLGFVLLWFWFSSKPNGIYISSLPCDCTASKSSVKVKTLLAILIMSAPTKSATRQVIRETWLSDSVEGVKPFFVVGTKNLNTDVVSDIEKEVQNHRDLLILEDFSESYSSLTEKVLNSFQRVNDQFTFDYLLKCDDDSYVIISRLLKKLDKQPRERLYLGYFKGGGGVKRSGKWKESSWFMCDTYLPYAYGGGYILSSDLVDFIVRNHEYLQIYNNEDVSVGTWLSPLKITRVHDNSFDTEYKSRGCFNGYIVTHKQTPRMIREKHAIWQKTGNLCEQEKRERYAYVYNWTVPATQCCNDFSNTNLI